MDDFLGFGGLFDLDGDGSLDAGETAFGLMMMDDVLTDEDAEDSDDLFAEEEDSELELMTGFSRDVHAKPGVNQRSSKGNCRSVDERERSGV